MFAFVKVGGGVLLFSETLSATWNENTAISSKLLSQADAWLVLRDHLSISDVALMRTRSSALWIGSKINIFVIVENSPSENELAPEFTT